MKTKDSHDMEQAQENSRLTDDELENVSGGTLQEMDYDDNIAKRLKDGLSDDGRRITGG